MQISDTSGKAHSDDFSALLVMTYYFIFARGKSTAKLKVCKRCSGVNKIKPQIDTIYFASKRQQQPGQSTFKATATGLPDCFTRQVTKCSSLANANKV